MKQDKEMNFIAQEIAKDKTKARRVQFEYQEGAFEELLHVTDLLHNALIDRKILEAYALMERIKNLMLERF